MRSRGLALILVVGVLAVLAVLGSAFAVLSRLERRAAAQRLTVTRANLLARSGLEDAAARLAQGQDPAYGGEDFNANGTLDAGTETAGQVFQSGVLNTADCPVRQALRPSFFVRDSFAQPDLRMADNRARGYSGGFSDKAFYALKVEDLNGRIYVNGGALDAWDRDPDGPASAPEGAPLVKNGVEDYHDTSMEGPNGFLVRMLNNLDAVVTGTIPGTLGDQIVGGRPEGGYRTQDELKAALGSARYDSFKIYLTLQAWVDPTVLKPQPTDARPLRWEDIDDTHRIASPAATFSGVVPVGPLGGGDGSERLPWTQTLSTYNEMELTKSYPITWERSYLFAWRQLRLAPPMAEPRAPVSINSAPEPVLAAVLMGLKGTWLETWEGAGGWDDGFGWLRWPVGTAPTQTYAYPAQETDVTPWLRTRQDYGMAYGIPGRPWYGPANYDPNATDPVGSQGKPLVQCAPLGRLKECPAITPEQAKAIAAQIRKRISQKGTFRSWAEFNAFVDALPRWEDLNDPLFPQGDLKLDGDAYTVTSGAGTTYSRKMQRREDFNSDGILNRQVFLVASGSWTNTIVWVDRLTTALSAGDVPGFTFVQKDLIRAMANPNTDLNDFNPDANLFKEIDKTDVAGFLRPDSPNSPGSDWAIQPANAYVHTTELALDAPGCWGVSVTGRIVSGGRVLAGADRKARLSFIQYRDTTQADFMKAYVGGSPVSALFQGPAASYPLVGSQPLVSYPEPQTVSTGRAADAAYDGQVSLGFTAQVPRQTLTPLRGPPNGPPAPFVPLFDSLQMPGSVFAPDLRGPFQERLIRHPGQPVGALFPDGAYSEKDSALKYADFDVMDPDYLPYAVGFWLKVNWNPESSPRIHALVSETHAKDSSQVINNHFGGAADGIVKRVTPLDDILTSPMGLWFFPNRNGRSLDTAGSPYGTGHGDWLPARALILGESHNFCVGDSLNRAGYATAASKPLGRLQAHRWQYLCEGSVYLNYSGIPTDYSKGLLGRTFISAANLYQHEYGLITAPSTHLDGTANHLRLGEVAGLNNMNYAGDATFADLAVCFTMKNGLDPSGNPKTIASIGRYCKESGAAFTSSPLPTGFFPSRVTWTEIPCDLWFDKNQDGWMGDPDANPLKNYKPLNDQFAPSGRDVHIEIEVWDGSGLLGRYRNAEAVNPVLRRSGRLYYKAVFVNEWDNATRLTYPLDVTPFLDDVTLSGVAATGPLWTAWEDAADD